MRTKQHIDFFTTPCGSGIDSALIAILLLWCIAAHARESATNLWSIQPLVCPNVPEVQSKIVDCSNPVDRFIEAKLESKGLHLSPEADRRTLIRRLYFDLIGLPPSPEEIETFIHDGSPNAYDKLVDRLLASPQYGERWARHWLDVVHFGETHGYDKDKPRPNAWPYRDYVIRSFNEDKPWPRFVEEQVAGDVLYPFTRDGIEALGFIAAGPWDFIGHAEVPESKMDGKVARNLDRDDMVANTIQSFNSLTVQCARCHDHKFDPISQEDYYSLQAVFAAVDRADKAYDFDPAMARNRARLDRAKKNLETERNEIRERVRKRAGDALTKLDAAIAEAEKASKKGDAFGYHSAIEPTQNQIQWVQVDLGRVVHLDKIVMHPAKDEFNNIGEGFGFPVRFKIEAADDPAFAQNVRSITNFADADFPNPGIKELSFSVSDIAARFVRITATKLAPRQNDFNFALAELEVFDTKGTNVALGATVDALDSVESPPRWQKSNLTDGWYPGAVTPESAELARLKSERSELLGSNTPSDERSRLAGINLELQMLADEDAELPKTHEAFVASVYSGSGAFAGTGANGGRPRPIFILNRGSVENPGKEVGPGTLHCIASLPARFDIPPDHPEGERRAALAKWLSSTNNPLTWRSIVNRVWQQHFGKGIVETPNDFGNMGGQPSHPELLDWLACEFRDGGQSLKELNRLIVTSTTYRQASAVSNERAASMDADNRLLWRMNRRQLEAEAVRDAMLSVSGRLDLKMGGPSFQDFVIEKPEHSPHYEYELHDPDDPASQRRTIYRFLVRSQPEPFMAALDCADPSMQVARRNESVTALQSLALLNNSLVVTLSKHFAAKLERDGGSIAAQTHRAFYDAIGRPPTEEEAAQLTQFATDYGMENLCRALFNLNEFAFVD
ncbi:DUF1553 domain-containing protein [bacterium]|nr:DUF1553 domain-containing protein [bacterium]